MMSRLQIIRHRRRLLMMLLLLLLMLLLSGGVVGRIGRALLHPRGGPAATNAAAATAADGGAGGGRGAAGPDLEGVGADVLLQDAGDGAGAEVKLHVESLFRQRVLTRIFVQHDHDLEKGRGGGVGG